MSTLLILTILIFTVSATVDLNFAEFEYLSNHLSPEECRRLVAAAHFQSYLLPNALDQAERKISKDISCLKLLLHWNSADGEGRGETHEALELRLREMGKYELADWLGRTVFHQLGEDLDRSLREGLKGIAEQTTEIQNISYVSLMPVALEDPTEWTPFDTICYTLLAFLFLCAIGVSIQVACVAVTTRWKQKKEKSTTRNPEEMELLEAHSSSESEAVFDIREHNV